MFTRFTIPLLSVLGTFAAVAATPSDASAKCVIKSIGKSWTTSRKDPSFDAKKFVNKINAHMKKEGAVGFASLMQDKHGRRVLFTRRGWAVSPCDSKEDAQPFTLNTVANWGSVSKLVTAATVLNTIRRVKHAKLSTKMSAILPSRWRRDMHARFRDVTVSMLLQHRGGFLKSDPGSGPWHASKFRTRLRNGELSGPKVGTRKYSNASMGSFHFTNAFLWSPAWVTAREHQYKNLSDTQYDERIAWDAAKVYNSFTHKFVLKPSGVKFATCNAASAKHNGKPFSLGYKDRSDTVGSFPGDKTAHCAAGGWAMSAKDMMRVLYTLAHTSKIITPSMYKKMEHHADPDARLGYAMRHTTSEGGLSFSSNGSIGAGNGKFGSWVITYPNGHQFVIVTNTKGTKLGDIIIEAYNAAYTVPGVGGSAQGGGSGIDG